MVRPWALSAPIMVLLICLPLMRPLRHPALPMVSDDEQARLATIDAIVEHHTLAIEQTEFRATRNLIVGADHHWYSDQPPVMSALLSGPYWLMHRFGISFQRNPVFAEFLLTLLGVTLPVAFAAGLFYRMGRIFELPRPARAALALAVVIGSGWISYATVLSSGAAAAALVVMAAAALVQATITTRCAVSLTWIFVAGTCAALGATYDLTALAFLLLLLSVLFVFRWSMSRRVLAAALYVAAAALPLSLHAALTVPITGDLRPGFLHPELRQTVADSQSPADTLAASRLPDADDEPGFWNAASHQFGRFFSTFFGMHGLFTHFPILIVGIIGVSMVMHRHWPPTTKVLASITIAAAIAILVGCTVMKPDWRDAMFANRWFLVFLPLLLFWSGAWLRRKHRPLTWTIAGILLAFSSGIAILGATDPQPRQGYDRYTAAGAFEHLVNPPAASSPQMLASQ